jgi:hypothetical protein
MMAHQALNVAFHGGLLFRFPLIVLLATAADPEEEFGHSSFEVHFQRDERKSLFERPVGKPLDLPAVEQQLAGALGDVIKTVRLHVFRDIAANEPDLAVLDPGVRLVERHPAAAQALDLAPDQDQAAFERIEHEVVVPGLAVLGHHPFIGFRLRAGVFSLILTRDGDSSSAQGVFLDNAATRQDQPAGPKFLFQNDL